jgi:tetratricopeptide (TPR) repeat protein
LRDQNQPAQALIAADKALAADTSGLAAHRLRAGCFDDLKRWQEALQEYQLIVARPDARDFDFGQAALLAARMGKGDVSDSVSAQGILRFPDDSNLCYYRGWSLLNLHRATEAITAFEMAEKLLGGGEPPTLLLAGEVAANWAVGAKDESVATYVRLINIDKSWADSSQVGASDLTEAEIKPIVEALTETLRRHPELKRGYGTLLDSGADHE